MALSAVGLLREDNGYLFPTTFRGGHTLPLIASVAYFFPPDPSRKLPTVTMSEQKQSSVLPLPIQSPVPCRSSWKPRILLGILFLLATAINFGPSLSSVSERAKCHWGSSSCRFHDDLTTRFDMEQLKDWAKCPQQPKPIYPNMTWEMTEEERARSIEHYAQAVVISIHVPHPWGSWIADGLITQRIPTQSYDDNGEPHEDLRWKPFFKFQDWLKETYPLAYDSIWISEDFG